MKKRLTKLALARETIADLNSPPQRIVGGRASYQPFTPLQPSSEADWSDVSVCPSICFTDCTNCRGTTC